MITKEEMRLHLLKIKKMSLNRTLEKVEKKIQELSDTIKETLQYKNFVKNKYCIVCENRDKKNDFAIPDGIVCTHPCNKKGKDRFQCYSNTCKHWVKEKKDGAEDED